MPSMCSIGLTDSRMMASTLSSRRRRNFVVVKYHGQPRIGAESLAAGSRRQINLAQIHRHGADGADAIQAQFCRRIGAQGLEAGEVVEHAG